MTNYEKLTNVELKKILKQRGLKSSGMNKATMIALLRSKSPSRTAKKGYGMSSNITPNKVWVYGQFVNETIKKIEKARKEGWIIDTTAVPYELVAPANHPATKQQWAATYYRFPYGSNVISIPDYFWRE